MVQFTIVPTSDIITCFQPCCAAPNIWNTLLHDIRVADSFGRFRQSLRTDLYSLAFHNDDSDEVKPGRQSLTS